MGQKASGEVVFSSARDWSTYPATFAILSLRCLYLPVPRHLKKAPLKLVPVALLSSRERTRPLRTLTWWTTLGSTPQIWWRTASCNPTDTFQLCTWGSLPFHLQTSAPQRKPLYCNVKDVKRRWNCTEKLPVMDRGISLSINKRDMLKMDFFCSVASCSTSVASQCCLPFELIGGWRKRPQTDQFCVSRAFLRLWWIEFPLQQYFTIAIM